MVRVSGGRGRPPTDTYKESWLHMQKMVRSHDDRYAESCITWIWYGLRLSTQHEVCCTIPDGYASVIPTLGCLGSCLAGLFEQPRLPTCSICKTPRLLIAGHDAAAKARRTFETVLARTRRKLKSASSFQVGESSVVSLFKCRFCIGFSWIGTREDILRCARPRQLSKSKA